MGDMQATGKLWRIPATSYIEMQDLDVSTGTSGLAKMPVEY